MSTKNPNLIAFYPDSNTLASLKSYVKANKVSLSQAVLGFVKQGLGLNKDNDSVTREEFDKLKAKVDRILEQSNL